MQRTDLLKGVGTFALIVVVVLGSTVAAGTFLSGSNATSPSDASTFTSDSLLATPVADDGAITAPDGEAKTVVIDRSHANAVEKGTIQPLIDALVSQGHEVRFHSGSTNSQSLSGLSGQADGASFNETLQSADAFVVINPGSEYTPDEITGLETFADAGGRVLMLADPVGQSSSSGTSLPAPLGSGSTSSVTPGQPTNLAAQFDISFGAGYLYDMSENANHFQSVYASSAGSTSLTADTGQVVLQDAAALTTGPGATPLFESESTLSSTRRVGNYTVAAQSGNATAVGDTDFLAPASATVAGNERFISNIAAFLVTGEKAPNVPTAGSDTSGNPNGVVPPQNGTTTTTSTST